MIARRGSRLISVGGRQFRWTVRRKPTYAQSVAMTRLNVAVALAGGRGSKLVAHLEQVHPGNVMGKPRVSVTPSQVAGFISTALEAGWCPDRPGPTFEIKC